jgi:hypothetical protein
MGDRAFDVVPAVGIVMAATAIVTTLQSRSAGARRADDAQGPGSSSSDGDVFAGGL